MARGKKPGAVSGEGALARRTDLTPAGSKGQPVRTPGGQDYGDKAASVAQQQAAPMAAGGGGAPPSGPAGAAGAGGSPLPPMDVFGPTERPDESVTAGLDTAGLMNPDDPDMMLQLMYEQFPHPSLGRLIPDY